MKKNKFFKLAIMLCLIAGIILTACACNGTPAETKPGESQKPTEQPTEAPTEAPKPEKIDYTVKVVDGLETPLEGATVQLCIGDLCQLPVLTKADGVAVVNAKEDEYTVKVTLKGYEGEAYYSFPEGSTELTVTLNVILGSSPAAPIAFEGPENNEITVPAGETVYYVGRFGGSTMKLYGRDVTVTYNGTDYTPDSNFKIELPVGSEDFFNPPLFAIKNTGSEEATYEVKFVYPEGNMNNPAKISMGDNSADIEENSDGYFFTWTASESGTFVFEIAQDCANWAYTVNNITASKYGETASSIDATPKTSESITVTAGDVVQIVVGTADYKAGTVKFTFTSADAE